MQIKLLHSGASLSYNHNMKKRRNFVAILLFILGTVFLCLGCMEVLRRIDDTNQTMQTPHSTESSYESNSTDTEDSNTSESTALGTDSSESAGTTESTLGTTETAASTESLVTTESTAVEEPYVSPYADYFTEYPDIAAWFQIPGTTVDYPVMWTPEDETYYLYRHYDGSDNINGSLLLDTDSSLSPLTTNLIIHGHNMKSGAMFGNLTDYKDKSYYEQHKEMLLYMPDGERRYEVIAVFRSQVYKKTDTVFKFYKFFQADTEEEFHDFYDNIKKLSLYDTGVTAQFGDHFITLSTCVSHVERGRFVVVAKEITDSGTE